MTERQKRKSFRGEYEDDWFQMADALAIKWKCRSRTALLDRMIREAYEREFPPSTREVQKPADPTKTQKTKWSE